MKLLWGAKFFDNPNRKIILEDNYFEKLVDTEKVWKKFLEIYNSDLNHIELDISKCSYISNTGVTILAALGPIREHKGRKISIEYGDKTELATLFTKFEPFTQTPIKKLKGIPFRRFRKENEILKVLDDLKLIEEISKLDEDVRNEIRSRLYELCINACEHGKNDIGTVCNGTVNVNKNYLTFTVFDFGDGIKNNVNKHLQEELSTKDSLNWAFKESNSTKQSPGFPRGAGFTTTFGFVKKYNGQFILYTNDICCVYKNDKFYYRDLDFSVLGTLITITIKLP